MEHRDEFHMGDEGEGEVSKMTPKCLACIPRWVIVPLTEIGHAGRGSGLGEKGHDFSFSLCFEVTVIHLRIVRQAVVFIDLELNRKYGLEI